MSKRRMFPGGPKPPNRPMSRLYDMDGKPMDHEEWGKKYADVRNRRIKLTGLNNADGKQIGTVSTVLRMDFVIAGLERPLIFETGVFCDIDDKMIDRMGYRTKEDAAEGHDNLVELWCQRISEWELKDLTQLPGDWQ